MKDNDLLMVVIAFVIGFMLQGMMKNMCGQRRLKEGNFLWGGNRSIGEDATRTEWSDYITDELQDSISSYRTMNFGDQPSYEDTPDEDSFISGSTYLG